MDYEIELSYNGEMFKVMVDLNTHVMLLRGEILYRINKLQCIFIL